MIKLSLMRSTAARVITLLRYGNKKQYELKYWKGRSQAEGGTLKCGHYEQFYTTIFELTHADYEGGRVLDIGCGPRGSLEWADMAAERIGLDPLANDYVTLRANQHKMSYVAAVSEHIPFPDGYFNIVASFNSLDHVDDLQNTIAEVKRIARPGGLFLLIVEINHPPTPTEPITLRREVLGLFAPEFVVEKSWTCALLAGTHDVYGSVLAMKSPDSDEDKAILCARLRRTE